MKLVSKFKLYAQDCRDIARKVIDPEDK